MHKPGMVAEINKFARELECSEPPPGLDISLRAPLSPADYQEINDLVDLGPDIPIIRIEDWSPDAARDQPTPGAERVLIVTTWLGYDKCLGVGGSDGFIVEKVGARWKRVGKGPRFRSFIH